MNEIVTIGIFLIVLLGMGRAAQVMAAHRAFDVLHNQIKPGQIWMKKTPQWIGRVTDYDFVIVDAVGTSGTVRFQRPLKMTGPPPVRQPSESFHWQRLISEYQPITEKELNIYGYQS